MKVFFEMAENWSVSCGKLQEPVTLRLYWTRIGRYRETTWKKCSRYKIVGLNFNLTYCLFCAVAFWNNYETLDIWFSSTTTEWVIYFSIVVKVSVKFPDLAVTYLRFLIWCSSWGAVAKKSLVCIFVGGDLFDYRFEKIMLVDFLEKNLSGKNMGSVWKIICCKYFFSSEQN